MINILLYLFTALIWGSTWLSIHYQLGIVPPLWSVAYRFMLAGMILLIFCLITKRSLRFSQREHLLIASQGILLFSLNYILYYYASEYFSSGLIAVMFASIIIMNIFNSRLFYQTPLLPRIVVGALLGLAGLALIFTNQIVQAHLLAKGWHYILSGIAVCLIATYIASLGNMVSIQLHRKALPILQTNTLGIFYGTFCTILLAMLTSPTPTFDISAIYVGNLLYLSLFGTVIAFGTYLSLLRRIGASRAAYIFVLLPIIAMLLSAYFENFQWSIYTIMGIALVIWGNVLVLSCKA